MATKIFLPRLGESITEAVIGRWLKKTGDPVTRGEVIAELETAKAMMELESPVKGTLLAILPKVGDLVHMEELVAVVGAPGEVWEFSEIPIAEKVAGESSKQEQVGILKSDQIDDSGSRLLISPNAKRRAKELGIDPKEINQVEKNGRINACDVEMIHTASIVSRVEGIPFTKIPLNRIQSITAQRMEQSAHLIPQFSLSIDVNAERLINFVNYRKLSGKQKVTITAILVWKIAEALTIHPRLNSRFDKDSLLQFHETNIAIAVDTPEGLLVPVLHNAQKLSLDEIVKKLAQLTSQSRNKQLGIKDTQGGTFTISNLGMKGITSFIPLVDPSQAAILGVGAIRDGILWDEAQILHRSRILTLSLAADHRVVGGAEVSDFLAVLKQLIETL
jgi:pyruvate dehydrogenase E2 component (dihydrolipoamide acetyltransferase)